MSRDPPLTSSRPGLADAPGRAMRVAAASVPLRREPRPDAPLDTEALRGDPVTVYGEEEGWAWGQLHADGYVGYLPAQGLAADPGEAPTHRVRALRTFVYPGPDLKLPPADFLSLGAGVTVAERSGAYAGIGDGWVWAAHLREADAPEPDWVAVAERFSGTPYLWGGRTSLGLDCSGLVQAALAAAGVAAPRDSHQQEAALGQALPFALDLTGLRRGDLVFWRGHVGIMRDASTLLHANGHHMMVAAEPLAVAAERIARTSFGAITSIRRLAAGASSSQADAG